MFVAALAACSLPHARVRGDDGGGSDASFAEQSEIATRDAGDDGAAQPDATDESVAMDVADEDGSQSDVVSMDQGVDVAVVDGADGGDAGDSATSDGASDGAMDGAMSDAADDGAVDAGTDAPRDAGCLAGTADCGDGICRPVLDTVVTCSEATRDGVHVLTIGGTPFCAYCQQFGMGPRWTMVLKANGADTSGLEPQRFAYDSALWTNTDTYLEHNLDRDTRELKTRAFSVHPLREVLVEMSTGGTIRSLRGSLVSGMSAPITSLRAVFSGANNTYGGAFRVDDWLGAVPDSRLQDRCRRVGFNVRANDANWARVRIGAIGNENVINDCDTHDSWVGVGGVRETSDPSLSFSAGNVARYNGRDNRTIRSHATVWVRE